MPAEESQQEAAPGAAGISSSTSNTQQTTEHDHVAHGTDNAACSCEAPDDGGHHMQGEWKEVDVWSSAILLEKLLAAYPDLTGAQREEYTRRQLDIESSAFGTTHLVQFPNKETMYFYPKGEDDVSAVSDDRKLEEKSEGGTLTK